MNKHPLTKQIKPMLFKSNSDFFVYKIYLGKSLSQIFPPIFRVVTVYSMYIQSGYIAIILSTLVGANI